MSDEERIAALRAELEVLNARRREFIIEKARDRLRTLWPVVSDGALEDIALALSIGPVPDGWRSADSIVDEDTP